MVNLKRNGKGFLKKAIEIYGDKIIVGVDALNGEVRTQGWLEGSGVNFLDFARELKTLGVSTIIFTDISKDGTLEGVNHVAYKTLVQEVEGVKVIASGGVKDIGDIIELAKINAYGAILGKSLYSNTISLKEAISYEGGN